MNKPIQSRTLKTRAKLVDAAKSVIADVGYEALRVEEVVRRAGVAKGTFFAHFKDKDALMDQLLGAEMDRILDDIDAAPVPATPKMMVDTLAPLIAFMTCERYVFDVIIRYSGAAAVEEIGPIAQTFERQYLTFAKWMPESLQEVSSELLAEGIQAFLIQALSLKFCALHGSTSAEDRLVSYLQAWLR